MSTSPDRAHPAKALRLAIAAGTMVLALLAGCRPARAQTAAEPDWTRLELSASGTVAAPGAEVKIAGVPDEASITVDLGADRWPGSVRRDEGVVVLTPRFELPGGVHRLRLFEHLPDGVIEERANWRFEVGGDAVARAGSLAFQADLEAGWRIAEEGPVDPRGKLRSAAGARFRGDAAGPDWRLAADVTAVHNSRFADRRFSDLAGLARTDVGTFLLAAAAGPVRIAAGDQGVAPALGESLILASLYRRGLTAELDFDTAGSRLSGFAVSTRPVVGSEADLGVGDADERIEGGQLSQRLFDSPAAKVNAAVIYLDADGSTTTGIGIGAPQDPPAAAGDSWSGAITAELFDERLRLEAEWAESRFDPDGEAGGARRHRDGAFALAAVWSSWVPGEQRPLDWEVAVRRRHVGANFRSLANPALLNGRDTLAASGQLTGARFDFQFDLRREEDEVGGRAEGARADTAALALTWDRPPPRGEERGWLAPRGFTLSWYQSGEEALSPSDAAAAADRSSRTWQAAVNGDAWSLAYTDDRFADDIAFSHRFFDAGASFFGERWSLRPTLQWARFAGFGGDRTTLLARLAGERALVGDRLRGSLAVDVVQVSEDDVEDRVPSVSGELSWQLLPTRPGRPRATVWLRGHYTHDGEDEPAWVPRLGQLFLGVRLSWRRIR